MTIGGGGVDITAKCDVTEGSHRKEGGMEAQEFSRDSRKGVTEDMEGFREGRAAGYPTGSKSVL